MTRVNEKWALEKCRENMTCDNLFRIKKNS